MNTVDQQTDINFNENNTTSREYERNTQNSGNDSIQNNALSDSDTIHSANTSNEYYLHFAELGIK